MIEITVSKRDLDLKSYKMQHASRADFEQLVSEPAKIYDEDGNLLIVYCTPHDAFLDRVKRAVEGVSIFSDYRTNGLKTHSRVIGFEPRKALRKKDYCGAVSLRKDDRKRHDIIMSAGAIASQQYQLHNPTLYEKHRAITDTEVDADYHISGMPYTSGIINRNNALMYHFDTGNFRNVWSGMFMFKNGVSEGYLSMPEYNIGFNLADKSLIMFDGQGILHGVTPITKLNEDATRHTIVYYSLQQMWSCLPLNDEILRARKRRDETELNRRNGILPNNQRPNT